MKRSRRPRTPPVLFLVACLLALTGCSDLESTGDKGYIAGDGSVAQISPGDRSDPVELAGDSLSGDPVDISDYRGRVVVVNTWWSGCPPCRTEMPMLAEAADELSDDAAFVGINIRDSSADQGLAFERGLDVGYPSVYAPDGKALLAFSGKISLGRIPTTAILDRQGRVAAVIAGPIPSKLTLTELVDEIAAEPADG